MTADEEEHQFTAGASWLRRLYRFETGLDGHSTTRRHPPATDGRNLPDPRSQSPARRDPESSQPEPESSPPRSDEDDLGPGSDLGPDPGPGSVPSPPGSGDSPAQSDRSPSPLLDAIRREADVADVRIVGQPADHAYGRTVEVALHTGGERRWGSLRLFRRPTTDEEEEFESALGGQLERWADASDVPGVVPVLDAAASPRPWTCTAPLGTDLRGFERRSLPGTLRDARHLARTLVALHERGVVHAGLDPDTVVYHTDPASGVARPRLDLPGLVDVYRRYADPARFLDPRYAAPEYFDSTLGVVDRTTDVYGFGAVLFGLLTGRPPYVGTPTTVRDAVLDESVPVPSAFDPKVPESVDDLVVRAMQPAPFDRFETADALLGAVEEVCRRYLET